MEKYPDFVGTLRQINSQIEEIRLEGVRTNIAPVTMKDNNGDYIWAPLVIAKAQVLHGIGLLRDNSKQQYVAYIPANELTKES